MLAEADDMTDRADASLLTDGADKLTRAAFGACVGDVFRVPFDDGSGLDLKLVDVLHLNPAGPSAPRQEPFSLEFVGPDEPVLPQRIYHLEHARLGALKLFLVPLGPGENGMRYESVFN
jgi:hypothetical protein